MDDVIVPASIEAYVDKVQFWLPSNIDRRLENTLVAGCGKGGLHKALGPARFCRHLHCRIELKQPSDIALKALSEIPNALVNRIEVALDLCFKTRSDRDAAFDFIGRHLIRRWHSKNHQIRLFSPGSDRAETNRNPSGTRYDGPRSAPNLTVVYKEGFCRTTGELFCVHLEWRANGLAALRRAGITCSSDLVRFDHREFWENRLLFRDIAPERLGLLMNNRQEGTKRRMFTSHDRRVGAVMIKSCSCVQEILDRWGSMLRLHRALMPIPNTDWLPDSHTLSVIYQKESPTRSGEADPSPTSEIGTAS